MRKKNNNMIHLYFKSVQFVADLQQIGSMVFPSEILLSKIRLDPPQRVLKDLLTVLAVHGSAKE